MDAEGSSASANNASVHRNARVGNEGEAEPGERVLRFATWQSKVEVSFWEKFSQHKLEVARLDETPIQITGFYQTVNESGGSSPLTISHDSIDLELLELESREIALNQSGNFQLTGKILNMNTKESFRNLNKIELLRMFGKEIWEDIMNNNAEKKPSLLNRFFVICYSDIKSHVFIYQFCFPVLIMEPPAKIFSLAMATQFFSAQQVSLIEDICEKWKYKRFIFEKNFKDREVENKIEDENPPFFLIHILNENVFPLKLSEYNNIEDKENILFTYFDHSNFPHNPGWILRNFLFFCAQTWNLKKMRILSLRNKVGKIDLSVCPVFDILIPAIPSKEFSEINITGWEKNSQDKFLPKIANLSNQLDPIKLSESSANLNLKLMTWQAFPNLDLKKISNSNILILGSGTLGCNVARNLMAWGFRNVTFVDNAHVSFSNPIRQSLFFFEDCIVPKKSKAELAAQNLKKIFPSMNSKGVHLTIPMPGHFFSANEEETIRSSIQKLVQLVKENEIIFLLTDSRESRWLPTLLCSYYDKIVINAALGLDTFLVMRHGASVMRHQGAPTQSNDVTNIPKRLGCYFCSDIVAPINSIEGRSLDQNCTISRPGASSMTAALAVELLVSLLHHPMGIHALTDHHLSHDENSKILSSVIPHQIRYFLFNYNQILIKGEAYEKCIACSLPVMEEFEKHGEEFVLRALNEPSYLEDLTGISEMLKTMHLHDDGIMSHDSTEHYEFETL